MGFAHLQASSPALVTRFRGQAFTSIFHFLHTSEQNTLSEQNSCWGAEHSRSSRTQALAAGWPKAIRTPPPKSFSFSPAKKNSAWAAFQKLAFWPPKPFLQATKSSIKAAFSTENADTATILPSLKIASAIFRPPHTTCGRLAGFAS